MTAPATEPGRAGMAGHTPGEWRLVGTATIRAGRSDYIATVNWRNRAANACLIAAAPLMFDFIASRAAAGDAEAARIVEGIHGNP